MSTEKNHQSNPDAKLRMENLGEPIKEFRIRPVAVYLSDRLGISYKAAYVRVLRVVSEKMVEHDYFGAHDRLVRAEYKKIGGTILISREAVVKYFLS